MIINAGFIRYPADTIAENLAELLYKVELHYEWCSMYPDCRRMSDLRTELRDLAATRRDALG